MSILSIITIAVIYAFGGVGLYAIFLRPFTEKKIDRFIGALAWPITIIAVGAFLMFFMFVSETD